MGWASSDSKWRIAATVVAVALIGGGCVIIVVSGIKLRDNMVYYWDVSRPCRLSNATVKGFGNFYAPSWTATIDVNGTAVSQIAVLRPGYVSTKFKADQAVAAHRNTSLCVYRETEDRVMLRLYLERPDAKTAFGKTVGFLFAYVGGAGVVLGGGALAGESVAKVVCVVIMAVLVGLPYLARLFGGLGTAAASLAAFSSLPEPTKTICAQTRTYASGQIAVSILLIAASIVSTAATCFHFGPRKLGTPVLGALCCLVLLIIVFEMAWLGYGARGYPWDNACNAIPEAQRMWRLCVWAEFFACWTPALYSLPIVAAIIVATGAIMG